MNSRPMPAHMDTFTRLTALSCMPHRGSKPAMSSSKEAKVKPVITESHSDPVKMKDASNTSVQARTSTATDSDTIDMNCSKKGWKIEYMYTRGGLVAVPAHHVTLSTPSAACMHSHHAMRRKYCK